MLRDTLSWINMINTSSYEFLLISTTCNDSLVKYNLANSSPTYQNLSTVDGTTTNIFRFADSQTCPTDFWVRQWPSNFTLTSFNPLFEVGAATWLSLSLVERCCPKLGSQDSNGQNHYFPVISCGGCHLPQNIGPRHCALRPEAGPSHHCL